MFPVFVLFVAFTAYWAKVRGPGSVFAMACTRTPRVTHGHCRFAIT